MGPLVGTMGRNIPDSGFTPCGVRTPHPGAGGGREKPPLIPTLRLWGCRGPGDALGLRQRHPPPPPWGALRGWSIPGFILNKPFGCIDPFLEAEGVQLGGAVSGVQMLRSPNFPPRCR